MTKAEAKIAVKPGQSWAIRDPRYDGPRYVTVERVSYSHAFVRPRHANGRRSRIMLSNFWGSSKFSFCGYDGPGELPPFAGDLYGGCLNCGPRPTTLPLSYELEPGFGATVVTRNGHVVWKTCRETNKRLAHMELWARDLGGDWRINLVGPLSETLYQRKPEGWILVWKGFGFA